ncbi:MAG: ribosome-associated translation inhibitor RaiA [Anaerolineae bacterium]
MDVTIQGQNVKITESLEEYTHKKVERLARYLPNITAVYVDFARHNTRRGEDITTAQITVRHARGAILRTEERVDGNGTDAMEAAINLALDKMYTRIRRFKGKRTDSKRRGRYNATLEELDLMETLPDEEDDYVPDAEEGGYNDNYEIIRRKEVMMAAMNEQEAIAQMELLGHAFFMFLNGDTGQVNVMYRREGGGYGVLVPQS